MLFFFKSWICAGIRIAYRSGLSVSLHVIQESKDNENCRISVFYKFGLNRLMMIHWEEEHLTL